jgi:pimeloyl-ACP methyl ester carboxylesterase
MTHTKTIVFIHGLFQNPKSWIPWKKYFEERGYTCYTPAYPYHEGEPEVLRKNINPELSGLTFGQVVDSLSAFIDTLPEKPILIGHSMGGLAVQKLIGRGKGAAGVCLDTAPPRGVISFKWSFLRANFPTINPLKGNSPCLPSVEWFHYAFCNTMTMEETKEAYDLYVVPESRNIPRSGTGKDGAIDFKQAHAPLLIIAGEKDNIIPSSLNKKNFDAYTDSASRKDFKEFPGRTHFIASQKGWEEVAEFCESWMQEVLPQ